MDEIHTLWYQALFWAQLPHCSGVLTQRCITQTCLICSVHLMSEISTLKYAAMSYRTKSAANVSPPQKKN